MTGGHLTPNSNFMQACIAVLNLLAFCIAVCVQPGVVLKLL